MSNTGYFIGEVIARWLEHPQGPDRDIQLLEDFGFKDPAERLWHVPKSTIVNGASIPQVLWSTVGPPFIGDYRRASVVHDYYCDARTETWQSTHRMFYHACRTGGVRTVKAKIMYAAVYAGGPRWRSLQLSESYSTLKADAAPGMTGDQLDSLAARIEEEDLSLEQIDTLVSDI